MRHIALLISVIVMIVGLTEICHSESLEVTATPVKATAKRGEVVAMSVNLKNALTPREPVTFTAAVEWQDEYGEAENHIGGCDYYGYSAYNNKTI